MTPRLLIAGGGPTGLAAAIHGVRHGFSVQVIEPGTGTIDKACGEGLMPAGVAALARLGVDATTLGHPFRGIRYVDGPAQAEADFAHGPGVGIRRLALHSALRAQARAAGVAWVEGRVRGVEQDHQAVHAHLADGRVVTGHWLLGADGLRSTVRRALDLDLPRRRPLRIGLRQHYAVAPWSDFVEVHWHPAAECYITPVGPELVGVAMLVRGGLPDGTGQSPFARLLERFPAVADRVRGAPTASTPRGAGPFETRVARRSVGRVLLVGDAAGYLDPLTGEGLKLGFLGAEAAVEALARGRPEAWERAWRRITRRYYVGTGGLLTLTERPLLRRWLVPVLSRAPWLLSVSLRLLG